jgi:formylaminopyrimidine deformylase / aminopyrimidine aminohydrolase
MIDLRGFRNWAGAHHQPFVRLLQEGQVSDLAFRRWLRQEQYLYETMLGLQTALLRHAPPKHRLIKANALVVTVEQLDWLENLELPVEPVHPIRRQYLDFLASLEEEPYAVATVAHWTRHRAFFDVWNLMPMHSDNTDLDQGISLWDEIMEHWTAPEAQALVHDFGSLALEVASEIPASELDALIAQVLEFERQSWNMALAFAKAD